MRKLFVLMGLLIGIGCDDSPSEPTGPTMSFFVTSATSVTGHLGGLAGADATCQRLAAGAGQGARTWRAYLSVERDPANGNQATHAPIVLARVPGTTRLSPCSPGTSPNFTPALAMPRCSSRSAGSGSTVSGPDRLVQSSTTS